MNAKPLKSPGRSRLAAFLLYLALFGAFVYYYYYSSSRQQHLVNTAISIHPQTTINNRLPNLRSRSIFHHWQGASSEWLKRSPIGRFLFVFYELQRPEKNEDPVFKALTMLSQRSWSNAMNFVAVDRQVFLDSFSSILPDSFFDSHFPSAVILDIPSGFKKYILSLNDELSGNLPLVSSDTLVEKLSANLLFPYQNRSLRPYLRSELVDDLDAYESQNLFLSINSELFQKAMTSSNKTLPTDFFLLFQAPWCGQCRRLELRLNRFLPAIKMMTKNEIGFFRMDATRNDVDHPSITLFRVPALYYFKSGEYSDPKPFPYRVEDVNEENLKSFLLQVSSFKKHLSSDWSAYGLDEL